MPEVAVIALLDPKWIETVTAVVVLKEGATAAQAGAENPLRAERLKAGTRLAWSRPQIDLESLLKKKLINADASVRALPS